MTEQPSISVIVRTCGQSARLAEALDSLAEQTRRDFEVVAVDMSRGRSEEVLARAARRLPGLRRLVHDRRLSRPVALNVGIAATRAPRIGILDEDNLYDHEHLERLVSSLEATGADYVYTGVRHVTYSREGQRLACRDVAVPFRFDHLLFSNYIYATGSGFRKALWTRLGGYDERFAVFEDWDFILRTAQAGKVIGLPVISGESRKFTGIEGISSFDLEIRTVRRCHAGIYWKHRHLFRGELRRQLREIWADHCRRRIPARSGLLARSVAGWRLEIFSDLFSWWGHNLTGLAAEEGS